MAVILMIILMLLSVMGWIYEMRTETEDDKKKKMWLFDHDLY